MPKSTTAKKKRGIGVFTVEQWCDDPGDEGHGLSSFALEDGVVYHVYSTYGRGTDVFNAFYQLLDRAPMGRDEEALLRGEGEWWWRRHDEYGHD